MDAVFAIIFLLLMLFGFGLMYKNRFAVGKWLNDSSIAFSHDPKTRRKVLRRRIEDAEEEIAILDEIETK